MTTQAQAWNIPVFWHGDYPFGSIPRWVDRKGFHLFQISEGKPVEAKPLVVIRTSGYAKLPEMWEMPQTIFKKIIFSSKYLFRIDPGKFMPIGEEFADKGFPVTVELTEPVAKPTLSESEIINLETLPVYRQFEYPWGMHRAEPPFPFTGTTTFRWVGVSIYKIMTEEITATFKLPDSHELFLQSGYSAKILGRTLPISVPIFCIFKP